MREICINIKEILSTIFIIYRITEYNPFNIPESVVNSLYQDYPEFSKQDIIRLIEIYQSISSSDESGLSSDDNTDSREITSRIYDVINDVFFSEKKIKADKERKFLESERRQEEDLEKERNELRHAWNIPADTHCFLSPEFSKQDIIRLIELNQSNSFSDESGLSFDDSSDFREITSRIFDVFFSEKIKADKERECLERERRQEEDLEKERNELRHAWSIPADTPCFLSEEASRDYGSFQTLSDHDKKAFLYWRSELQKGRILDTPRIFIRIYLYGIANFIEYDSVEECISAMKKLTLDYSDNHFILRDIHYFLDRFLTFYGDEEDIGIYLSEGGAGGNVFLPYLPIDIKEEGLLHGDYSNALSILSVGGHKIKESQVYRNPKCKDIVDQEFSEILRRLTVYFADRDIDFMRVIGGIFYTSTRPLYDQYVRPVKKRIYEKSIYSVYGELILQVKKDMVLTREFRSHALRSPLRKLILRIYENNLRERFGIKRKLKIDYSIIKWEGGMTEDMPDVEKIYKACISPDFLRVFPCVEQ